MRRARITCLHVRLRERHRVASQPELGDVQRVGGEHPSSHAAALARRLDRLQHLPVERHGDRGLGDPLRLRYHDVDLPLAERLAGRRREPVAQPRRDGRPDRAPDRWRSDRRQPRAGHVLRPLHVIYPSGAESFGSPQSLPFTVSAGNVPELVLPPLPNGATGYDIYLSDPSADPGSAVRYASGVTTSIFLLQNAAPDGGLSLPPSNTASSRADRQPDRRRDDRRPAAAGHV